MIYLISEKMLRESSMIDENVDSKFINYAILQAQETTLTEIIGSSLYDSIIQQVKDTSFKSDEYKTLLDNYIQPFLVNEVMSQIVIPIQYKIKNAGIVLSNDQHYQTLTMSDTKNIEDYYKHKAVWNSNRMIEYIAENKDSFSEIKNDTKWIRLAGKINKCPIFFK